MTTESTPIFWEVWHDLHPDEPLWPTELDETASPPARTEPANRGPRHAARTECSGWFSQQ
jgi:hypothetical protein